MDKIDYIPYLRAERVVDLIGYTKGLAKNHT